jgi:3-deoxy-D-manno-octulosonic-acid transferase
MMWLLYNVLFCIGYVALMPKYLLRMWRRGGYREDFHERFGRYAPEKQEALAAGGRVWVHAVSVGEAMVALTFIQTMRERRPDCRFLISVTTSTGHALLAARRHPDDLLIYFPADFPWIARRVAGRLRPAMLVLAECELWPNLLRMLYRRKVPVFVINGRISESSYRGYRLVRPFFRRAAQWVTHFLVQTDADAARLAKLGVAAGRITVTGSAKYDVPAPAPGVAAAARRIVTEAGLDPAGPLWVMGSTWPGEEAALIRVFKALRGRFPALQAVLVPRHMERRQEVARELEAQGVAFVKRSDMAAGFARPAEPPSVLLADTTGELQGYYSIATLVYVGKSLAENHGGQNPIEPAALSKAVVTGPNMENFAGVMTELLAAGALMQVRDEAELLEVCGRLLGDAAAREALGSRAGALVEANQGVMAHTVALILEPGS